MQILHDARNGFLHFWMPARQIVHATEEMVPIDNPSSAGIDPEGPENKDTDLKEDSSDENGYSIQQSSIESNISKESEASK